jgi:electron transport complex protein RnfB
MSNQLLTAVINETECIGCSRCIPVCPVDAIIGASKFLHTVLLDECVGCKLCVDACPVDCISMVTLEMPIDKPARALKAKERHKARMLRLQRASQRALVDYTNTQTQRAQVRAEIQAAVERARNKQYETR